MAAVGGKKEEEKIGAVYGRSTKRQARVATARRARVIRCPQDAKEKCHDEKVAFS